MVNSAEPQWQKMRSETSKAACPDTTTFASFELQLKSATLRFIVADLFWILAIRIFISMLDAMRVYHFLNRQYGLENIQRRRLKIATINELNDPFEMIAAASPDQTVRQALLKTKEEMNRRYGLLCFSRDWHNTVQWGHYAERHQGLCLGFDVPEEVLQSVHYQPRRIRIDPNLIRVGDAMAEKFMIELISTKSSHWRYENEVRCFTMLDSPDPDSGHYFAGFSSDLSLREVIVGHRSSITRTDLTTALGDLAPSVLIKKARLAFRSFRIVTQRRKDLWT